MTPPNPQSEDRAASLPKVDIPPESTASGLPPVDETIPPFLRKEVKPERPQGAMWLVAEGGQVLSEFVDFCGVVLQWLGSWSAALWTPLGWPLHPLGKAIRRSARMLGAQASALSPEITEKAAQKESKSKAEESVQQNIIANNLLQRGIVMALVLFLLAYMFGLIDSGRDGAENIRLARLEQRETLLNDFANFGARSVREMQRIVRDGVEVHKLQIQLAGFNTPAIAGETKDEKETRESRYRYGYELWNNANKRWQENINAWRELPNYTGMAALIRARFISTEILEDIDQPQRGVVREVSGSVSSLSSGFARPANVSSDVAKGHLDVKSDDRDPRDEQRRLKELLFHYEQLHDRLTELNVHAVDAESLGPHGSLAAAVADIEAFALAIKGHHLRSEGRVRPWLDQVDATVGQVRKDQCTTCHKDHSVLQCRGLDCQAACLYSVSEACATSLEVIYVEIISIIGTMLDEEEPLRTPMQRWIVDPFIRWVGA